MTLPLMLKTKRLLWIMILILSAGCRSSSATASPTTPPQAVLTAAAETADARLTELARPTETATPTPPPIFDLPTVTPTLPTLGTISPTLLASPGAPTGSPPPPSTGGDLAEYWADITVPDGTQFDPGEKFTKVWRLRNSGATTWTPDYSLAFFGGAQMSAPTAVSVGSTVAPGSTVDISVDMVAPLSPGTYRGFWKMRNAAGEFFDYAVFVEIQVIGGTPGATTTPGQAGNGRVTDVRMAVDDASPDECPYTFTFTGTITLSAPATVTYRLEAGSDTPGFTFNLPSEQTGSFGSGTHTLSFFLTISSSVDGWAQLHVLAPNDVTSNQATFSLRCSP